MDRLTIITIVTLIISNGLLWILNFKHKIMIGYLLKHMDTEMDFRREIVRHLDDIHELISKLKESL